MALAAWCSSTKPTNPFITSSTAMIAASAQCRASSDNTSAASIIQGMGAQKYPRNASTGFRRRSAISLAPYCCCRRCASAVVSPCAELSNSLNTCSSGFLDNASSACCIFTPPPEINGGGRGATCGPQR